MAKFNENDYVILTKDVYLVGSTCIQILKGTKGYITCVYPKEELIKVYKEEAYLQGKKVGNLSNVKDSYDFQPATIPPNKCKIGFAFAHVKDDDIQLLS